jgi:cytochrome P450
MERIERYVDAGEEGSLVGLIGQAPSDAEVKPAGQVPHWLFALGDTLAANAFRALALIVSHPSQRGEVDAEIAAAESVEGIAKAAGVERLDHLEACLEEAMRLYPTTPILSRETVAETDWRGVWVDKGTQVLISNTFNHRDPERHDFADRFAPDEWTEGEAAEDWSFNHFSHGPQGCPGAHIALFVGKGLLAHLLTKRRIDLTEPSLDPSRPLPHMLDVFRTRFAVEPKI